MKYGVVIFPGSNCDRDTVYTLGAILEQEVVTLWHKSTDLRGVDAVVLPGGFSFGDYLRSGALARFSPIMESVVDYAGRGGRVLGICNGFQVLCEAGLLPGVLRPNRDRRFICRHTYLLPEVKSNWPTASLQRDRPLHVPIAHAEGAYFVDDATLAKMRQSGQLLFRYCNADGRISDDHNPNGSAGNIAGVCNAQGNVVGMMPHPERASDPKQGNTDGALILRSIHNYWFN